MRIAILIILLGFATYSPSIAQQPNLETEITQDQILLKRKQYQKQLDMLEIYRIEQLKLYKSGSPEKRKEIVKLVKAKLETQLSDHIFPAWYGTPWDFNGTSNEPGKGNIACGYFVSTSLKHLGFKLNRFKLAQQPSQRIIGTFMRRAAMDISSQRSISEVKKKLMKTGDGIYIVGLDSHVGFIAVKGETITFIHSSYYQPDRCVKAEPFDSRNPLADSTYRVVGKLFHDEMVINWLQQKLYTVSQ